MKRMKYYSVSYLYIVLEKLTEFRTHAIISIHNIVGPSKVNYIYSIG